MRELKGFLCGILISVLLFNPVISLAKGVTENITVYFNKVNININGVPKKMDNFIYNNVTYVPLKAISEALGKELVWDGKTSTANIYDISVVPEERGNSIGNIINGSYVASEGEWIYYINTEDTNKIYRINKDGSNKTKIYDNFTGDLSVLDGWLYFTSYDDEDLFKNIYKMKTDGTNRIKLSSDTAAYINVVDNWIYYSNLSDSEKIYKIKTDGSCRTKLGEDPSRYLIVKSGWIYYIHPEFLTKEDKDTLFKVRTDGSDKTKLNEGLISQIIMESDWIYYINYHTYPQQGIALYHNDEVYKIRRDGSEKTRFIEDDIKLINISDGWIYYTTKSQLCKVRTDGSQKTVLEDEVYRIWSLYVIDEWIYYQWRGDKGLELYRMKLDGADKVQVF